MKVELDSELVMELQLANEEHRLNVDINKTCGKMAYGNEVYGSKRFYGIREEKKRTCEKLRDIQNRIVEEVEKKYNIKIKSWTIHYDSNIMEIEEQ